MAHDSMDMLVMLLHNEPPCKISQLIKRIIQIETKLQYDVLSKTEFDEDMVDLLYIKEDQNFTPEQEHAIVHALQQIYTLASTKFLDTESR